MDQLKISRKGHFMDPEFGADCKFLVGGACVGEAKLITGHKLIFANASPVFKNMFFGSVPEEGDLIKVPDIHPDIFQAMVKFFYTGEITIDCVGKAIHFWYVANKYNIAELRESLPPYISEKVTSQNVFRILRLPVLHRNKIVMKKCCEIILAEMPTFLNDSSSLESVLSTLSFILDQEEMFISEMDLFRALVQYDNARKDSSGDVKSEKPPSTSPATTGSFGPNIKRARISDGNSINSCGEGSSNAQGIGAQGHIGANSVMDLVKKIRFLTMTPKEFTECLGMSSLIPLPEAHNILVNICNPSLRTHPMPEGYCTMKEKRGLTANSTNIKIYSCEHAFRNDLIEKRLCFRSPKIHEFSFDFQCNAKIKMTGVRVNSIKSGKCKVTIEILNQQSDVLYQSSPVDLSVDFEHVSFKDPVHIEAGLYYTIRAKLQKADFAKHVCYAKYTCSEIRTLNNIIFEFGRNINSCNCKCKGFIKSICFSI